MVSVTLAGQELEADAENDPVSAGEQEIAITFSAPLTFDIGPDGSPELRNATVLFFPSLFPSGPAKVSEGGTVLSATFQLAEDTTYQLFIPYVRKGLHRARCSIVVQVDTSYGRRVTSDMANIVLPGSESLSEGAATRYELEHTRLPAGRVHAGGPAAPVVAASAQSPLSSVPAGSGAASRQTPKFESFSIPYDYHRANAR